MKNSLLEGNNLVSWSGTEGNKNCMYGLGCINQEYCILFHSFQTVQRRRDPQSPEERNKDLQR